MTAIEELEKEIINLAPSEQLLLISKITKRLSGENPDKVNEKKKEYKLSQLKNAMKDKLFTDDLKEIERDFQYVDSENW